MRVFELKQLEVNSLKQSSVQHSAQIWEMASGGHAHLNQFQFSSAMRLVALAQVCSRTRKRLPISNLNDIHCLFAMRCPAHTSSAPCPAGQRRDVASGASPCYCCGCGPCPSSPSPAGPGGAWRSHPFSISTTTYWLHTAADRWIRSPGNRLV